MTITHEIHENAIPPFVDAELERLYANVYCTLTRLQMYDAMENASTYVARSDGVITAVLLFHLKHNEIKVFNQQIELGKEVIGIFSELVFLKYKSAKIISFYAIRTDLSHLSFPFQKFTVLEENILTLPPTPEQYIASLGGDFRYKLRSSERKLKKQFPTFRYDIYEKSKIDEQTVRDIIGMTGERMAFKQKQAYIRDEDVERIIKLIRAYGFIGVATIDGRMCAGHIWYQVGTRFIMHLVTHDPLYDRYMLGNLLLLLTFCDCIERGGRECWLMGGGQQHKLRFLARPSYLDSLVIYRSRGQVVLNLRRAARNAAGLLVDRTRTALHRLSRRDHLAGRASARLLALARSVKQSLRGTSRVSK